MPEPGRESMSGVVSLCSRLCRGSQGIGDPFRRTLIVCRESHPDVAVIEKRMIRPISFFDLIQGLRDQESPKPVGRHEGKRGLEEVQPTERRELIEHEK